jgi:hypothetical protein
VTVRTVFDDDDRDQPVDPEPHPHGSYFLLRDGVRAVQQFPLMPLTMLQHYEIRYRAHGLTCPNRGARRLAPIARSVAGTPGALSATEAAREVQRQQKVKRDRMKDTGRRWGPQA